MPSINRVYESRRLTDKNFSEWLSSEKPLKTYEFLKDFWRADIKPPKLSVGDDTTFNHLTDPNGIIIRLEDEVTLCNIFELLNNKQPFSSIAKVTLGEEMTHYLSYHLAPDNFEKEEEYRLKWVKSKSAEDFLNYASLGCQLEGIGFLGRKAVAESLDIENYVEMSNNITKCSILVDNKKIFKADTTGIGRAEVDKNLPVFLRNTFSSTGELSISKVFEREYKGRFSELIRRSLDSEAYRNEYIEFVRNYFPRFGAVVDRSMKANVFDSTETF
ncbi:MAG: hypothetical protein GTN36_01000 [Candidatus Aenigmarchaeota archaeon]|nr:hypothetical protein [Candidatus Aenigmarchaeota archaeon]